MWMCRYRVYHHYRTEGWVARSGYQLGCDWLLYKQSPATHHATYTVLVQGEDRATGEVLGPGLAWRDLLGRCRVAAAVRKEVLVARVAVWGDRRDWSSPHCLGGMGVVALRVRRWVPGEHRWRSKPEVPRENEVTQVKELKKTLREVIVGVIPAIEPDCDTTRDEAVIVLD